jgi:Sec-independent protein secretion pathway component TatC
MRRLLVRGLLRLFPTKWRKEYGEEFEDLLMMQPLRLRSFANVAWSGLQQQLRITNHPLSIVRCLVLMAGVTVAIYVVIIVFAFDLWRMFSAPAYEAFRSSGNQPVFVQVAPSDTVKIVWFELPALITAFVAYPVVLCLAWLAFASRWKPADRSWTRAFGICSGALFILSGGFCLLAWQHGAVLSWEGFKPVVQNTSMLTVTEFFGRFAKSAVGFATLVQVPVLAVFLWRLRVSFQQTKG